MPKDMTPTTLWRESMRLWMRVWQMNADMALAWWKAAGLLPPPSIDPEVQKICEEASHPHEVPDPVPAATERRAPAAKAAPVADTPPARRTAAGTRAPRVTAGKRPAAPPATA